MADHESPPRLTDRNALAAHRSRARRLGPALFLHDVARAEAQDRVAVVNRAFTKPAIVSPFAEVWRDAFPDAVLVPDDDTLALAPGAHDLVIHALALHWSNDPVGQIIQCRRALEPDGHLLVLTFGGRSLHHLRTALAEAEIAVTGGLSPRVLPMGEIRDLGALLQRAGLALPVADGWDLEVRYGSALALMQDLRAMGETNAMTQRLRHFTRRAVIQEAAARYDAEHGGADGRVPAHFEILALSGWAPDASQPQPLRPGSATARLADALGTDETPLKR